MRLDTIWDPARASIRGHERLDAPTRHCMILASVDGCPTPKGQDRVHRKLVVAQDHLKARLVAVCKSMDRHSVSRPKDKVPRIDSSSVYPPPFFSDRSYRPLQRRYA